MLSRQESSLSSSRRQLAAAATPPPETHHAKAIGCMSGIFQLFSKYYHPKKRLTSGKQQEKIIKAKPKEEKPEKQIADTRKLTCETKIPRSPTLPPEIRSESPRTPSSLVARLMGLEEIGTKKPLVVVKNDQDDDYGIVERRRKQLMQALEKCNEDLEDLKRIIRAVQTADVRLKTPRVVAEKNGKLEVKKGTDEEMSPVCVLDEEVIRSPRVREIKVPEIPIVHVSHATPVLDCNLIATKKSQEIEEPNAKNLFFTKYSTVTEASMIRMRRQAMASPPQTNSRRAMVETIEQVCKDIAWGEKREVEKIGLVLQDNLFKDMVEEVVQELKSCGNSYSLPLERCKKRLSF